MSEVDELAALAVLFGAGLVVGAAEVLHRPALRRAGELGVLVDAAAGELADGEAGAEGFVEGDLDLVVVEDALVAGEAEGGENLGRRLRARFSGRMPTASPGV